MTVYVCCSGSVQVPQLKLNIYNTCTNTDVIQIDCLQKTMVGKLLDLKAKKFLNILRYIDGLNTSLSFIVTINKSSSSTMLVNFIHSKSSYSAKVCFDS